MSILTAATRVVRSRPRVAGLPISRPLVVAHRGASGYRPEHTLEAFQLAVAMGADALEVDVVSTRDGVLVARHENALSGTTDVADRPAFLDRLITKKIDGLPVRDWFIEDFSLDELKSLRTRERFPRVRRFSAGFDGRFTVATLDEVLDLTALESGRAGRTIGLCLELKSPSYFRSLGLPLEESLIAMLSERHLVRADAAVQIQSFDAGSLRRLSRVVPFPLVQLVGRGRANQGRLTRLRLQEISTYAQVLGAHRDLVVPRDAGGWLGEPTGLVREAHAAGLRVHVWTLRSENRFLARQFRQGHGRSAHGNAVAETWKYLDAGVDAVFTDHPDTGVEARAEWLAAGQQVTPRA